MKKTILILMLAMAVLTAGFSAGCAKENPIANQQNAVTSNEEIDAYMASVKEQSDAIKTSVEQEELTQTDLNIKSTELSELWDGAVEYLLAELENRLTEEEFSNLQSDQLAWIAEKEKSVEEAGIGYEGGSFYSFVVNWEAARITEERALELYDMLK